MKRVAVPFLQAIVLVALGALAGCAYTDYGLITDNDQLYTDGNGSTIVNTNGKAHFGKAGVVTLWPDGTDELFHFVDQAANGDRMITTYNNFSTLEEPAFHDDLYCNPDWNGCAIFTAPDPEVGDDDIFDGRLNRNCSGARSLMILISSGRYGGECGRRPLSFEERLALMNRGSIATYRGFEGLLWDWDSADTNLRVENERGDSFVVPIYGSGTVFATQRGREQRMVLDATHPLLGQSLMWYAGWLDDQATHRTILEVCHFGVCTDFTIAGDVPPISTGARVRAVAARRY